jgi:hypothetical protein
MGFDQLPYRQIPIFVNRRRVKLLNTFRTLLLNYINSPVQELRGSINQLMPVVADVSHLAGVSLSEALHQRLLEMGYLIPSERDLLENFFWAEAPPSTEN